MKQATASLARNVMFAKGQAAQDYHDDGYFVTTADVELAAAALAWARGHFGSIPAEDRNDFEHNMYVVTRANTVPDRAMGFLAYVVEAYLRHLGKVEEAKRLGTSKHLGAVGDKLMLKNLLIQSCRQMSDGPYISYLYKFLTEDGNVVSWFASKYIADEDGSMVLKGTKVNLAATVKAHREFNGVAETTVTRGKVLTDEEFDATVLKEAKKAAKKAKKEATCP